MKRHLDKVNKCKIIDENNNKLDTQLYFESLEPNTIDSGLDLNIEIKEKKLFCEKCNMKFANKSNLNRHIKNTKSCKKISKSSNNNIIDNKIINNIQNIGVQNNIENINIHNNIVNNFNINVKSLRGFEEEWNTSNITDEMRKNLLFSDTRFTNTLKNILENDENLNVILKDESTGIVYKFKNDEYEAMHVKDILDISMDKIYKYLRDFLKEAINIDNKDNESIINEIDKKYYDYKDNLKIKKDVNSYLKCIFNDNKNKSVEKFIEIIDEKKDEKIILHDDK
jgi:Zn finger protein HypA/HybF involved in hydrogenase expression